MAAMGLVFITSQDCRLCSRGREVLESLDLSARTIDVTSPEAIELGARGVPLAFLPVLWDGRRVVAYGRFSERRLRRELAA